jgi:hypothetical protein
MHLAGYTTGVYEDIDPDSPVGAFGQIGLDFLQRDVRAFDHIPVYGFGHVQFGSRNGHLYDVYQLQVRLGGQRQVGRIAGGIGGARREVDGNDDGFHDALFLTKLIIPGAVSYDDYPAAT